MASREDILAAIQSADERAAVLRDRIIAAPEASLPGGDWRVREALSHLAARANPMPLIETLRAQSAADGEQPALDVNAMNAEQIAERAGKTVAEILDELHANYGAALAALKALDEEALALPVKLATLPNEIAMSNLVLMSLDLHVKAHMDEIEAAVGT